MILTHLSADLEAEAHSNQLTELLKKEISTNGWMDFSRFMQLALYAPGLGYYSAGSYKFGKGGDFVTAPELTSLFAQCIANYSEKIFEKMPEADFLELGAGSGKFAKDFLRSLQNKSHLPRNYFILEVSADLKERQQQTFAREAPDLIAHVHWIDHLPENFSGIIFANEVMDALPVHLFRINDKKIFERGVTWEENQFKFLDVPATNSKMIERVSELQEKYFLGEEYQSEVNLLLPEWIHSLGNILKKGIILLIDYGYGRNLYYHPQRKNGTLTCFYQHKQHANPLVLPGLQDITSHVDFTTVAESALNADLKFLGYTTQADFLLNCGILDFAEDQTLSAMEHYTQSQNLKKLLFPSEMGDVMKVMAFVKGMDVSPKNYFSYDRSRELE